MDWTVHPPGRVNYPSCQSENVGPYKCNVCTGLVFFLPFLIPAGVASLAETFSSLPVSGPFLPDLSGFHVPSGSVFPSQSSFRTLPVHVHFDNCSDVLCCIASFIRAELLQRYPSHDRYYRGSTLASSTISSSPVDPHPLPNPNRY